MVEELLFFMEVLVGGLLAGTMYSLVALGFVLIFKASATFNFSQGAMVFFSVLAFVGFMQEAYQIEISFVSWMKLAAPLSLIMLVLSWYALTKIVYPVNFTASSETQRKLTAMLDELGPLKKDEVKVLFIFASAALLTPPDPITQIGLAIPLLILYELSIFSVKFIENKKLKDSDA